MLNEPFVINTNAAVSLQTHLANSPCNFCIGTGVTACQRFRRQLGVACHLSKQGRNDLHEQEVLPFRSRAFSSDNDFCAARKLCMGTPTKRARTTNFIWNRISAVASRCHKTLRTRGPCVPMTPLENKRFRHIRATPSPWQRSSTIFVLRKRLFSRVDGMITCGNKIILANECPQV